MTSNANACRQSWSPSELDISYGRHRRPGPPGVRCCPARPDLAIEPEGALVASIDPRVTTADALLFQFVDPPGMRECRVMEAWKGHDTTAQTYGDLVKSWSERHGKLRVAGDPSGFNQDLSYGQSVLGEVRTQYGITVMAPPRSAEPPRSHPPVPRPHGGAGYWPG